MKTWFYCLIFICGTGFAQEPDNVSVLSTSLKPGEMFFFGDNSVQFQKVISDSRCPKEVACIWAGEAKVLIHVYEKGKFKSEKIVTVGNVKVPLNFPGENIKYSLSGIVLTPYPSVRNEDIAEEYILNLSITEKHKG